jgi:Membrane-bound metallopeptidase
MISVSKSALFSRIFLPALALAVLAFFVCAASGHAAQSSSELRKKLALEKKKADERRQNLKSMTIQERKINTDLAEAEKRILQLEKNIAEQQAKLLDISTADDEARQEYEVLVAEKKKIETVLTDTLRLLWEAHVRRMAVGGREMDDWAGTDREYMWSQELYKVLDDNRNVLAEKEKKLAGVLEQRDRLARSMEDWLASVNREKAALLQNRVLYDRQLRGIRQQRKSTETELQDILQLAENLNMEVARLEAKDIAKMKGQLERPVSGRLRKRFRPEAAPPVRGVGFSTGENAEVRSVAAGKVVHNDILRGFGTVIIIQHNTDYFTLYAYMGDSPLKVGAAVNVNQKLGTVGFYPDLKGPGLYFELRFKQKAINPESWFAS